MSLYKGKPLSCLMVHGVIEKSQRQKWYFALTMWREVEQRMIKLQNFLMKQEGKKIYDKKRQSLIFICEKPK